MTKEQTAVIHTKESGRNAVSVGIYLPCFHVIRATNAILDAVAKDR